MRTQVLTGLEGWFTLPSQPGAPPPPRYKMAVLTWVTTLAPAPRRWGPTTSAWSGRAGTPARHASRRLPGRPAAVPGAPRGRPGPARLGRARGLRVRQGCGRSGGRAAATTWSSSVSSAVALWPPGLKMVKFSKSVSSDSATCWVRQPSAVPRRSAAGARPRGRPRAPGPDPRCRGKLVKPWSPCSFRRRLVPGRRVNGRRRRRGAPSPPAVWCRGI
jgi:hypothetical protein